MRGLIFAFGAVIVGVVVTVVVWRLGFIASITSLVLAAGAVWLYDKGAGTPPRKGLVPLIALIVLGVVATFFAVIANDAWEAYDSVVVPGTQDRMSFVMDSITDGHIIGEYTKDMWMFALFAVLGTFGTLRSLMAKPA